MTTPFSDSSNKLALSTALTALEDIGKSLQIFAVQMRIALSGVDLGEREKDSLKSTVQEIPAAASPAAPAAAAQPAPDVAPATPKKTRAKKASATPSAEQPAPSRPEPDPAPIPEPEPAVQLSAQELDAAIALALQPPGTPIPEGMKVLDTFPTVEPDDSVTPEAMRELIKRLMAATSALHAAEGLQVVRGSLAAVGALRLAEVPDWQLLNLRSAITHGNIDLRVQIAAGEL